MRKAKAQIGCAVCVGRTSSETPTTVSHDDTNQWLILEFCRGISIALPVVYNLLSNSRHYNLINPLIWLHLHGL